MGALLVTTGALGTFALATSGDEGPTTSYLVAAAVAAGPLPSASVDIVTVTGMNTPRPEISVTLTLVVEFVMAPALPGDLGSTTVTRTATVSILG